MTLEEIGESLADLRVDTRTGEIKYTQRDLAKKLKINHVSIGQYEKGARPMPIKALKAYHDFFNVSYEYLLGESPSKHHKNIKVQEELGLSDKAIDVLQTLNRTGSIIIELVNKLIEQEERPKLDQKRLFNKDGNINTEYYVKNQFSKIPDLIPLLTSISNYLGIEKNNNKNINIINSGEISKQYGFLDILIKSIPEKEVVESILLLDIQNRLRELKKKWDL